MNQSTLISSIISALKETNQKDLCRKELYSNSMFDSRHEFLFFIKPELTQLAGGENFELILDMIFSKLDEFGLKIKKIIHLSASYLEKYDIIARHYGIINAISRNARENLLQKSAEIFRQNFNTDFEQAKILGGIEFLSEYPELNPQTLDYLWQNSATVKLGGGTYCQQLKIDGNTVYLLNGFHPRQLQHYTAPGQSIIVFTITGELDWKLARNNFIGKTNPAEAESGSIRRTILDNMEKYGLKTVNSSWNGVHLSAGPVESLVELIRYNSDFERNILLQPGDFSFGRMLSAEFDKSTINKIISNQIVNYNNKSESVFDLTEEKNNNEAINILKEAF
jgi:hypothetical protein